MKKVPKERLDVLLAARGLAESREAARRLVMAGNVLVDGHPAPKAGHKIAEDAVIELKQLPRFVSRGGEKLAAALEHFKLNVEGRVALDIGASTGGFTDCLLQNGVSRVYAFDCGRAQLHWKLHEDPRVIAREGFNARYLTPADLPEKPGLAVVDVSFISLTMILPAVIPVLQRGAEIVTLIKPQFEAGREQVARGGVVRDEQVRREIVDRIVAFGRGELGLEHIGTIESPLKGPAGNVEYLAAWRLGRWDAGEEDRRMQTRRGEDGRSVGVWE